MILILSQTFDPSTDMVIDWLIRDKKEFCRTSWNSDTIDELYLELTDDAGYYDAQQPINANYFQNAVKEFKVKLTSGVIIDLKKIKSVWYRKRGFPEYNHNLIDFSPLKTRFLQNNARKYVNKEYDELVRFAYFFLFNNPGITTLGSPYTTSSQKITYLMIAKMFGLKIPDFYVVSEKNRLSQVLSKLTNSITKGIGEMVFFGRKYIELVSYTTTIDYKDMGLIKDVFAPSAIQKQILKRADIRTVYFNGEIFSMAIFSQNNPKTVTDFRNYDSLNPNRNTPFRLPQSLEQKLAALCKHLKINFCSIDLIQDENNEFYFLEINPVGQFGMVSGPCNYNIEKKIAEFL